MLLIMGLGGQMIWWDERFCRQLAGRGYRVIRFDNRDIGLSTKLDDVCPNPGPLVMQALGGNKVGAALHAARHGGGRGRAARRAGIESAHVVGASMGGMIAQRMAIHFPLARALAHLDHVVDRKPRPPAPATPRS